MRPTHSLTTYLTIAPKHKNRKYEYFTAPECIGRVPCKFGYICALFCRVVLLVWIVCGRLWKTSSCEKKLLACYSKVSSCVQTRWNFRMWKIVRLHEPSYRIRMTIRNIGNSMNFEYFMLDTFAKWWNEHILSSLTLRLLHLSNMRFCHRTYSFAYHATACKSSCIASLSTTSRDKKMNRIHAYAQSDKLLRVTF